MTAGAPTIGGLKRLSLYLAGQLKSAVSITGGTISGVTISNSTISGNISTNTVGCSTQLDKTSDTTLANVAGLVQTVVPGTYAFTINLAGTSNASGGWKVAFKYTNAVLSSLGATAETYTASGVAVTRVTSTTDQASIIASTAANIAAKITGKFVVTTGGTIQLQFAQNASFGTASSLYTDSTMNFVRIA